MVILLYMLQNGLWFRVNFILKCEVYVSGLFCMYGLYGVGYIGFDYIFYLN